MLKASTLTSSSVKQWWACSLLRWVTTEEFTGIVIYQTSVLKWTKLNNFCEHWYLKAMVLAISLKFSSDKPVQYLDGWPLRQQGHLRWCNG